MKEEMSVCSAECVRAVVVKGAQRTEGMMRPSFCWKNNQRGVGVLGERPQDGRQGAG